MDDQFSTIAPSQAEWAFDRKRNASVLATWWFLGGCAMVAIAVFGFAVAIRTDAGQLSLHLRTTLPTLLAIAAFVNAWTLRGIPSRLVVGADGITIESRRGTRPVPWEQIGWTRVDLRPFAHQRSLLIYDKNGKRLASPTEAFEDFDVLVDLVQAQVRERDRGDAERIQTRKARRTAVLLAAGATVFLVVIGFNAWMALDEQRAERLLRDSAVPGEGRIVRRFIAPNGRTRRLEYEVVTADGPSKKRNVEVEPDYWDALEGAEAVPVVYVPSDPAVNRLAHGEKPEDDPLMRPPVMLALSGVLGLVCLVCYGAAILAWKGWDIDLDSKTKRLSIKRFGTGR